jgi:hypothetical protein
MPISISNNTITATGTLTYTVNGSTVAEIVDEKGNFINPPKPEEVIKEYFNSSMKVVYEFLGGKK